MEPFQRDQRTLHRTFLDEQAILSGQFWGELRVFLAVAKARSFNRAAELLNTSQPTVSRQVKRLQDLMGVQLIVPTKQGVVLTATGEALAESVGRLDHQLFSLSNGIKSGFSEEVGLVRISVTDGLGALFVAPEIEPFRQSHPRIQIHMKAPINITDLLENQTDIMIGFSQPSSSDLRFQALGHMHFLPIASRAYVQAMGLPTKKTLEEHRFVQSELYLAKSGLWDSWQKTCERGAVVHYCDNMFSYGMLVKTGSGIGLLGSFNLIEPSSVPLDLDVHISVPMYIVAVAERMKTRPVRIVYEWLASIFGEQNPWFAPDLQINSSSSIYDEGYRRLFNI